MKNWKTFWKEKWHKVQWAVRTIAGDKSFYLKRFALCSVTASSIQDYLFCFISFVKNESVFKQSNWKIKSSIQKEERVGLIKILGIISLNKTFIILQYRTWIFHRKTWIYASNQLTSLKNTNNFKLILNIGAISKSWNQLLL